MKAGVRYWVMLAVLAGATAGMAHLSHGEATPPAKPLSEFPTKIGPWAQITEWPLDKETLALLKVTDYLNRGYWEPGLGQSVVGLYIGYFRSQRTGATIHSPKNCLPGAGWSPMESERVSIQTEGHPRFQANRYIVAKGDDRQLVLYWYWAHDRAVASEYWAKFYLVADSIRMNRSDGSLIRVNTPLLSGENVEAAQQRLLSVVGNLVPLLDRYVPK